MKTTLFIFGIFIAFTNACNQNTESNTSNTTTSEKTVVSNNSDSIKNNIVPKETITEIPMEQTKSDNKTDSNLENKKDYFTLLSATSQSWTAGIPSGGSGIDYYFKVKINTEEKLLFDSAWINNRAFEIFISKETNSISSEPIKYGNGDIIILRVSDIKNKNTKTANSNPPQKFEGAALISYTAKDKREYFIIKEIKKQTSPNRQ